ncbi:MAG: FG-GAP-like repeat-containing protein, partial [bacterium]
MKRIVLALVTLLCVRAAADIIHVPGQYPTIQAGIDAARSGDIVLVAAGTYVEEINLKAGVVVRGAGMGRSIIDGNGDPGDVVRAVGNAIGPDTKLEGFTVRGAANGGGMPGGGGVFCNSGARPEIAHCRITANDAGVALWNGSAALVRNCIVDHNTYDGVSTGAGATIVNNTIHANRIGLYDYSGYGPVMMNNIVTGNSLYGVYGPSGGTPPSLTYNCVWGNATDYHQATPGIGSISHDPLYADTAAADYHLQPGSPCIDSGNPAPQYNDPDGSRCDIGAYGGPAAPSERPLVVTLIPTANDPACEPLVDIAAGFNVAMDPATLSGATFRAHGAFTGWHWGTVSYDTTSRVVTIEPAAGLLPGEPATAILTKSVLSSGGDSLGGYSWGFTAAVSGGSGVFADTIHASGTASNRCLCAADLDGDGDIDAAGGWSGANIYLNDGTGRLTLHRQLAAGRVSAIIAGDWNSDSIVDLAAAYELTGAAIAVWIGLGGGEFSPAVEYFCIAPPCDIDAADVNLDGHLDLVAANGGSDSVGVFWGYGDGTFTTIRTFPSGGESEVAAVGDVNNDGRPDIVTGNRVDDDLSVLLGNGDGTFERSGRFAAAMHPADVALADINGDGNLDAIVAIDLARRVLTMLGDGTGAFSGRREYPLAGRPGRLAVADFDGDARLDIAVPGLDSGIVSLLRGRGDGTFDPAVRCLSLVSVTALAAASLDADGDIDLVVGGGTQAVTALNYYALRVVSAAPLPYSPAVPPDTTLSAEFTVPLDPATLDSASFKAFGSMTGAHFGATNWDSAALTARLDPFADFAAGEEVTAVLTSRIRSVRGGGLGGYGWTFATWDFGNARGVFGAPNDFPAGSEVRGTWAADFDSDGDIDVAVTANIPAAVAILMNDGVGRFAAPVFTGTAGDPISLFGADFDSDGDVDLAVFHNQPGSSHLEILRND